MGSRTENMELHIASRPIGHRPQGSRSCSTFLFTIMASVACFVTVNYASSQQIVNIGVQAPAVEVNEDAVFYDVPTYRRAPPSPPLFNPLKDSLDSRVVDLQGPDYMRSGVVTSDTLVRSNQMNSPTSHVIELPKSNLLKPSSSETPTLSPETDRLTEPIAAEKHTVSVEEHPQPSEDRAGVVKPPSSASINQSDNQDLPKTAASERPISPEPDSPAEKNQAELAAITGDAISEPRTVKETSASSSEQIMTVVFAEGATNLEETTHSALHALVTEIKDQERIRLQLNAYASDKDSSASAARRLSLSRALAVRSFLIELGINSTRIDVRALGSKTETGSADRVDLIKVN